MKVANAIPNLEHWLGHIGNEVDEFSAAVDSSVASFTKIIAESNAIVDLLDPRPNVLLELRYVGAHGQDLEAFQTTLCAALGNKSDDKA
jgi:hypothetical protein